MKYPGLWPHFCTATIHKRNNLFLDQAATRKDIIKRAKEGVQQCTGHPAILCYTIGNEIPAPMVRWYGKKRIEDFLKRLYAAVKEVEKEALVTYVNYPTTEYLNLDFLDFDCFNVYLETPEKLSKYISRLHNLGGDRPLVLVEIGLDSQRNGLQKQARFYPGKLKRYLPKAYRLQLTTQIFWNDLKMILQVTAF